MSWLVVPRVSYYYACVEAIAGPFFKNNFVMLKGPNKNHQNLKKLTKRINRELKSYHVLVFAFNYLSYPNMFCLNIV